MELIRLQEIGDLLMILRKWEEEHSLENYDPLPTVIRLAQVIESQTNLYLKTNPDPLDERHPSQIDPAQALGHILKILNRKRNFMNKLVQDYFKDYYWAENGFPNKDPKELFCAICRLLLDLMPDPETCTRFLSHETDPIILRLFSWADKSEEPLRSYATGLLAATMKLQNRAYHFRDQNNALIPIMMQRLHELQTGLTSDYVAPVSSFSSLSDTSDSDDDCCEIELTKVLTTINTTETECKEENIIHIHPVDIRTSQMFVMRYLGTMGKYPEFVDGASDVNALELIFYHINCKESADVPLTCEALKYLSQLLRHEQFAKQFIQVNGIKTLLEFPSHSMCGTAVSVCLYSLSCNSAVMDQMFSASQTFVTTIIRYVLELLEFSHESGRCYATMFCSSFFRYHLVLKIFDAECGLRKLYNLIRTLSILVLQDLTLLNDDEDNAAAQKTIQFVCRAIKSYLEAHLCVKAQILIKSQSPSATVEKANPLSCEKLKVSPEDVQEHVTLLFNHPSYCSHWKAVKKLVQLRGIQLFLLIIEFSYEWITPDGSSSSVFEEILRCVLDSLAICCLMPQVKLQLCKTVKLRDEDSIFVGTNIILKAAEGKIVCDPKVQKSALSVVINCVCAPSREIDGTVPTFFIENKKITCEEILQKVWESMRNNGMMILLHLMFVKTPIVHADAIRALACRAVVGLARNERIRQSIRKLPLFTRGQLQSVMRNPVLNDKRQEHEIFQKNACELLECLELVRKRKRTPTPSCELLPSSDGEKND